MDSKYLLLCLIPTMHPKAFTLNASISILFKFAVEQINILKTTLMNANTCMVMIFRFETNFSLHQRRGLRVCTVYESESNLWHITAWLHSKQLSGLSAGMLG